MTDRIEVDVLVVGAGACGLIAALKAAQAGASVAVVEKLERFAGNTVLSCGSIPAAGTRMQREAGIADSVEAMIKDVERVSGPHDASHLTRTLVERSAEVVEWLVDHCGIEVKLYTNYKHVGHSVPRLHTQPSVVRQTDCNLLSRARALTTFARMSEARAVQMNGLGSRLWFST